MGYFSNMAVDMRDDEDHSYPSPERQLLWRLDDLKDRFPKRNFVKLSEIAEKVMQEDFFLKISEKDPAVDCVKW